MNLLHPSELKNPDIIPVSTFSSGSDISVWWEKHITPFKVIAKSNGELTDGIIKLNCGKIRRTNPLDVKHTPIKPQKEPEDFAHWDIV